MRVLVRTVLLSVVLSACGSEMDGSLRTTETGGADAVGDATSPEDGDVVDAADPDATPEVAPEVTAADAGDAEAETTQIEVPIVEIVAPLNGATVAGPITIRLEPVGLVEREVDEVTLSVNGTIVFADAKLPTELVLDTREHGTGPLDLVARARDGFEQGSHTIRVQPANPPLRFREVTPRDRILRNKDVVSLTIAVDGTPDIRLTADFSALDSGYVEGAEMVYPLGGNVWALTYIISDANTVADGTYVIPITASIPTATIGYTQLSLTLRNMVTSPITVPGAVYVDGRLPQPTTSYEGLAPGVAVSNTVILTGGGANMTINFGNNTIPSDVVGVIVGLEANMGYWQVPVDMSAANAAPIVQTSFVLRGYRTYEATPASLPIRVATRDIRGNVSPYATKQLSVTRVGTGDVQVSLSWDTKDDLDLHVRTPSGCEIYYGQDTCGNGELDLDSYPACSSSGNGNENVFWPVGGAPSGLYRVYVDFYEQCGVRGPSYTVTAKYCGKVEVFEGNFNPNTDTGGGLGAGVFVTSFNVGGCGRVARGKVRYEDRTFDKLGFGAWSWQTLSNAHVELRHLQTGEVIGSGTTDRNGNYEIGFPATGIPGFIVAVQARTSPDQTLREIEVLDHPKFKRLYEITSPPIIVYPDTEEIVQDVDITEDHKAGAFNVFDTLRKAYDGVRLQSGRTLGKLRAFWATGSDTTDTIYCSRYLYDEGVCTELDTVSVQGKESDRDEYDDMVITKEFFKFALDKFSRDSHPGGTVDGRRDDPRRAWSEGVATFFACDVTGSRYYVNSRPHAVTLVDDLEAMPSPFAIGRDDDGELSPWLVSALLWDLADPANEPWDAIASRRAGVYDTLFSYLPSPGFLDRGPVGVDLTDFLDGWTCRGWGADEDLEHLVADHHEDDYDFEGPVTCPPAP